MTRDHRFLPAALKALRTVALPAMVLLGMPSLALAADVTFMMQNSHQNAVEVELYSQDRNHIWPGNNEVYYLDDGETKSIALSCKQGENICYGAWVSGDKSSYWGTGPDNGEQCDDCCYVCNGGATEEINLVP